MKNTTIMLASLLIGSLAMGQVGINTDDPQSLLDVRTTADASNTPAAMVAGDGINFPRVTSLLASTQNRSGQTVYLTQASTFNGQPVAAGLYIYNGTTWTAAGSSASTATPGTIVVTEGGNTGVRISTANPANYGTIGNGAFDGSFNAAPASSGAAYGATGDFSVISGTRNRATSTFSLATGSDNTSSGIYSNASGMNTQATGSFATSTGENTIASANYSTASGRGSQATDVFAYAHGNNARATANIAFSFGNSTTASGDRSVSFGNSTTASGANSIAYGNNTEARGNNSIAGGNNTIIDRNHGMVIGSFNQSGDNLFTVGNGTGNLNRSDAFTVQNSGSTIIGGTGYLQVPAGTTAERPATAAFGMIRYNATTGRGEMYVNDANGDGTQGDAGWRSM